jgi:UDP-N-acetylmuramoyl-tripeptide--D-alanyl-D-alanine ligase
MTARVLWTVEAMAAAIGAEHEGALPQSVPGISIDSRTLAPGEAFLAIQGDHRDGHDFVAAALASKAGLAVVAADRRSELPQGVPLLVVPDVLAALRALAAAAGGEP